MIRRVQMGAKYHSVLHVRVVLHYVVRIPKDRSLLCVGTPPR